jgi:bacteriorhodopsin
MIDRFYVKINGNIPEVIKSRGWSNYFFCFLLTKAHPTAYEPVGGRFLFICLPFIFHFCLFVCLFVCFVFLQQTFTAQ